jgi:Glycosyltransferases involved in cell wall biogenesis
MIIYLILFLILGGTVYQYIAWKVENRKYKPLGHMVEIEGRKMHIFAQGEGPTVVLTAGLGTPSAFTYYYGIVEKLSSYARTVVYERPGYGWSESAKTPRTVEQITLELYHLLQRSGQKPPYTFTAHSFGSLEVLHFAQRYPHLVANILLLDAGNPVFYWEFQTFPIKVMAYFLKGVSKLGIMRIIGNVMELLSINTSSLPKEVQKRASMMYYSNWFNDDSLREMAALHYSAECVLKHGTLGDIPITILTAEKSVNKIKGWRESQEQLLQWSTRSQQKIIADTGHNLPGSNPDVVVQEVLTLLHINSNQCIKPDDEQSIKFSIVIPAYNEEKYITKCLDSIAAASATYKEQVEVIVVLNRCTDRTEEIASSYNCVIVKEDSKNLSKIRNAGVKAARGKIIVTIDADSWMSNNMLTEIENHLKTGKYIGGGVSMRAERLSLGIIVSTLALFLVGIPIFIKHGFISIGLFWCLKEDFEAINGFDEQLLMAEDVDFAIRLKEQGKESGKGYATITKAHITTSSRKFDVFGDWIFIKKPQILFAYLNGKNRKRSDEFYYDVKR